MDKTKAGTELWDTLYIPFFRSKSFSRTRPCECETKKFQNSMNLLKMWELALS